MRVPETLLIPGPVTVAPEVQSALGGPARAHYGDDWVEQYRWLTKSMARVFQTSGDVFLLFGPGTAALEACMASTLARGDEVLVAANGLFGERLADVARALGMVVSTFGSQGYEPVGGDQLAAALARHPGARMFAAVHHETSIGLLNPVRELCELAHGRGLLTLVDAVASLGGVPLEMDSWGIDLCVGVGNKCLGGPVGIAPTAVGPRAWQAVDDGRPKASGWYLNLGTWRRYADIWGSWHPHPTTMPTNAVDALAVALRAVMERGLEAHQAHLAEAATRTRDGLRELGFEMLIPDRHASPVTTAVLALPGMDVGDYLEWMRTERGLRLGGGLGQLQGRMFRVGHMGRGAEPGIVDALLRATDDYIRQRGLRPRLSSRPAGTGIPRTSSGRGGGLT